MTRACSFVATIANFTAENFTMSKSLSPIALRFLESRRICPEAATKFGVHSGSRVENGGVVTIEPDDKGNILVFPFIDGGREVGTKYRGPRKEVWQREGGPKTFWNVDIVDDPPLHDGRGA